jgi:hypothetical protein
MLCYSKIKSKIRLALTIKDTVKYLSSCTGRSNLNYVSPNDQRRGEIFIFFCVYRVNCICNSEIPRGDQSDYDVTTIPLSSCINAYHNTSQFQQNGTCMPSVTILPPSVAFI